jgi:hypothetical protein
MHTRLLPLLLIILVSTNVFGQVKPFRFGVSVAPNLAWLSPDSKDYESEGVSPGFTWGFMADVTLTDNYFIKTGFNIDYLYGKLSYPDQLEVVPNEPDTGTLNRKYNLRYLTLPVTLKMRTNQFGNKAFFGDIGFSASVNLKARGIDAFTPDGGGAVTETENDIKDDVTLFKGDLVVGAGMEFFIDNSTSIVTSISFHNGLSNVLKGDNSVDPSIKERANLYHFQLNIGVLF